MPARPVQGGSIGTWGAELDAWLDQFANADGTLVSSAVQAALGGSLTAVGDVTLSSDSDNSGGGDIILKTKGGTERLRIISDSAGGASKASVRFPVSATSVTQGHGAVMIDFHENLFTGTQPNWIDPTIYIGYNQAATGQTMNTAEPGWSWGLEADYDDASGANKMEAYLQWKQAGNLGTNNSRPFFIQMNRVTGANTAWGVQAVDFRINSAYGETPEGACRFQLSGGVANFFPNTGVAHAAGVKTIRLQSDGTNGTEFQMDHAGTSAVLKLQTNSTTQASLLLNSQNLLRIFRISTSGCAFSFGGTNENSQTMLVDAKNRGTVTDPVLTIRGMASQSGVLLRVQDSTPTTLWSVTAAGLPKWDAAGNQQTTVGAAGAGSALPATPVKYLKVVDSAGTTLVIPAYNP